MPSNSISSGSYNLLRKDIKYKLDNLDFDDITYDSEKTEEYKRGNFFRSFGSQILFEARGGEEDDDHPIFTGRDEVVKKLRIVFSSLLKKGLIRFDVDAEEKWWFGIEVHIIPTEQEETELYEINPLVYGKSGKESIYPNPTVKRAPHGMIIYTVKRILRDYGVNEFVVMNYGGGFSIIRRLSIRLSKRPRIGLVNLSTARRGWESYKISKELADDIVKQINDELGEYLYSPAEITKEGYIDAGIISKRSNFKMVTDEEYLKEGIIIKNPSGYQLWVCSKCGHEVLAHEKPSPIHWTDHHVCHFRLENKKPMKNPLPDDIKVEATEKITRFLRMKGIRVDDKIDKIISTELDKVEDEGILLDLMDAFPSMVRNPQAKPERNCILSLIAGVAKGAAKVATKGGQKAMETALQSKTLRSKVRERVGVKNPSGYVLHLKTENSGRLLELVREVDISVGISREQVNKIQKLIIEGASRNFSTKYLIVITNLNTDETITYFAGKGLRPKIGNRIINMFR